MKITCDAARCWDSVLIADDGPLLADELNRYGWLTTRMGGRLCPGHRYLADKRTAGGRA